MFGNRKTTAAVSKGNCAGPDDFSRLSVRLDPAVIAGARAPRVHSCPAAKAFYSFRMNHWLVKQEPEAYSWHDLERDGKTVWDGVRNFQARNNLRQMQIGDKVLFYHSVKPREVVGIAKVVKKAFPDPTTDDPRWDAVEIAPVKALPRPVSLDEIKQVAELQDIALIRQSRLSVMPLTKSEFETIVRLAGK